MGTFTTPKNIFILLFFFFVSFMIPFIMTINMDLRKWLHLNQRGPKIFLGYFSALVNKQAVAELCQAQV